MNKTELGSFDFAFELKDFENRDEFCDIGAFELMFQAKELITKPGVYAFKIIVTEIFLENANG